MPRSVEDLKVAVAEVEDVAVLDELCRRGGEDLVLALVVWKPPRSARARGLCP